MRLVVVEAAFVVVAVEIGRVGRGLQPFVPGAIHVKLLFPLCVIKSMAVVVSLKRVLTRQRRSVRPGLSGWWLPRLGSAVLLSL